jgi:CxxC motif-containing protein (DUF1111 family)
MRLRLTLLFLLAAAVSVAGAARDDLSPDDAVRVRAVTRPATEFSKPETFERMQGGAATTPKVGDANALSQPSANLTFADRERFSLGNGIFRKDWVTAPSSTQASDGLGPLFNSRNCQACHIKDGRGHAPVAPGADAVSYLVRLSVPPDAAQAGDIAAGRIPAVADPVYGLQLQDRAAAGLAAEGRVRIDYQDVSVSLAGGATVTLRKPRLSIEDLGFGPLAPQLMLSGRIAPAMAGMGLLEAIHDVDIMEHADPDDADHDGISGRPNLVPDGRGGLVIGRFGWKAIQPTVERQTAHAFAGDMGLSTPLLPDSAGDCTEAQAACRAMPNGVQQRLGDVEVPRDVLDLVVFYSQNLAPPVRRGVDRPDVLAGKAGFYRAGCPACHVPKYVTRRDAAHPAQRFQLIWPYSDLLLHDMGAGLADGRGEGLADGSEWRTPPLWGIGMAGKVSAEAGYLHDGRARTLEEAILWHGGEAQAARDAYASMDKAARDALVTFLESL